MNDPKTILLKSELFLLMMTQLTLFMLNNSQININLFEFIFMSIQKILFIFKHHLKAYSCFPITYSISFKDI